MGIISGSNMLQYIDRNLQRVLLLCNIRFSSDFLMVFLLLTVASQFFGCSSMNQAEILRQNTLLQQKNSDLAAELAEEIAVTANLQMKLVEKQTEIDKKKINEELLTQEIQQTKARIPQPESKVEVVAYLAEVEADINAAKELADDSEKSMFQQIDRLITESKLEFSRGNDETAHSLASQAMELTQTLRIKRAVSKKMAESTYAEFMLPLNLYVVKRSNIRKKPTEQGEIFVTLPPGTPVIAHGSQGDWIKVTSPESQEGWIHYPLLSIPATVHRTP